MELPEIPTILFVGAIGFQKGVPYLLEAVKELRQRGHRFRLKLIGRFERDFETWLASGTLQNLIDEHIPFVPNQELGSHFRSATMLCLASLQEGLALVLGEAMACGLPVVATESTGAREFVTDGESGVILPTPDASLLAAALEKMLLDSEGTLAMGRKAAEQSASFTWDVYGKKIEEEYTRILAVAQSSSGSSDEIASFYDEYWNREQGWTPTHSFTDAQLALHFNNAFASNDNVLDVGCGDASNYQSWLVKQVGHLSALDISPSGVATARRMGIDAKIHDLSQRFPFDDNTFEGATCIEVLEHLYDPKFTVQEIYRVLRPGGLLVASVPNNGYFRERLKALTRAELSTSITDFGNEWKGAHIRFYSLRSLSRMFQVSGFEIESIKSNRDASIFDGLDAFGGYITQHLSTLLRRRLPRALKLAFLEEVWPSLFAPHLIVRVRKPRS
jgi:SAM-dependent methyltransferase